MLLQASAIALPLLFNACSMFYGVAKGWEKAPPAHTCPCNTSEPGHIPAFAISEKKNPNLKDIILRPEQKGNEGREGVLAGECWRMML